MYLSPLLLLTQRRKAPYNVRWSRNKTLFNFVSLDLMRQHQIWLLSSKQLLPLTISLVYYITTEKSLLQVIL